MEASKKFITKVSEINDQKATLQFEDGQSITLGLTDLRGDLQVGDVVYAVFTEIEEEKTVRDMAKETLNELLNPNDETVQE